MPFIEIKSVESDSLVLFDKSVGEKLAVCDAEKFWSCKDDFELLINSNFASEVINNLISNMLSDPYATDMRNQVKRTILLQKETYSLVLSWNLDIELDDRSLNTHGSHAMVSILSQNPVNVDFYEFPDCEMEVYEPGKKLTYSHSRVVKPKELVEIHGEKWIVDIKPSPNLFLVTFIMEPLWNQIWAFDKRNLSSWSVSASSLGHTQLKIALEIFKLFKDENSIDAVIKLCEHENHDVRWEAIRTLGFLKFDLIEDKLKSAISDIHPHIRQSAAEALSQLQLYKKEIVNGINY